MINYKSSGLIYSSFNSVVKVAQKEYGWDLSYIKVFIKPMKNTQIKLVGNTLNVNPYFTRYLKENNLEFNNLKKFFVLLIAKELGKELYERFWDNDLKIRWNNTINNFDSSYDYESEEDKLSTFSALLIYQNLLEELNAYGKESEPAVD